MPARILFALIATFFVVMNVLLWRAEVAGRNVGSPVPVEIVWKKILTAPDISPMEVRHRGEKVGSFRWVPSIGEDSRDPRRAGRALPPEGMVKAFSRYDLEIEGQMRIGEGERLGFRFDLTLSTNYTWEDFALRVTLRPQTWELRSYAEERTLRLSSIEGDQRTERIFSFDDLRNPEKIVRELVGPWVPAGLLGPLAPLAMADPSAVASGVDWEARSDSLQLGTARIRGYRLRASLFGRFEASMFINTLGEIVRIDLPDQIVIVNEGLTNL